MAKRETKKERPFEPPLTLGQSLFEELRYALADIRHKVVEEGWFGRAVTPHWSPLKREHDHGIHGTADAEPNGSIHGKASAEPDGGVHGKPVSSPPGDFDGGVHGKTATPPADPNGGVHGKAARPEPWMTETGGFEALSEGHKRSAERSYSVWSTTKNPEAAARGFDLGTYVGFVQDKWAEKAPPQSRHPAEPKGLGMTYDEFTASRVSQPDQKPEKQPERQPEPEHSIDR
jgi:hypothetical protein